jgi:hypothetical protein
VVLSCHSVELQGGELPECRVVMVVSCQSGELSWCRVERWQVVRRRVVRWRVERWRIVWALIFSMLYISTISRALVFCARGQVFKYP